ncbi:MAG: T9SS type A sorting domain-containing protein [Bacteroidales bacterium]|nr:T9SS type A sorting domain-containing protein [Bacteroidales bacterium]
MKRTILPFLLLACISSHTQNIHSTEASTSFAGPEPPTNLQATVSGNDVHLSWFAPGGGGTQEELIYDNNEYTGSYSFLGYTMSTHMSPSEPCQVLSIKYYTTNNSNQKEFQTKIYNWNGSQPGTTLLYSKNENSVNDGWVEIDVEPEGLYFNGDFVVGFGSTTEDAYLGYDANFDNGRSWDLDENTGTWSSWNEAYMIRAVVRYGDGTTDELAFSEPAHKINAPAHAEIIPRLHASDYGNISAEPIQNQFYNLTGILGYNLYRNGDKINTEIISSTNATDILPGYGDYDYNVTAVYDEGESAFSPTATFAYYFGIEEINKNAPKIFPNPAHAHIFFSSGEKIMRVRLYGMDGSIHYDDQLFRNGHKIDVEHLPSGMYLIEIKTDNGTHSSKVVIR